MVVDTAYLPMNKQISIMKKTDYFVGIHGAGLSLAIFMPNNSILHEILPSERNEILALMSILSGHKTYSEIIKNEIKNGNDTENVFFNVSDFEQKVLKHMKENNFY